MYTIATVALKDFVLPLVIQGRPRQGGFPAGSAMYSSHVTLVSSGGGREGLLWNCQQSVKNTKLFKIILIKRCWSFDLHIENKHWIILEYRHPANLDNKSFNFKRNNMSLYRDGKNCKHQRKHLIIQKTYTSYITIHDYSTSQLFQLPLVRFSMIALFFWISSGLRCSLLNDTQMPFSIFGKTPVHCIVD